MADPKQQPKPAPETVEVRLLIPALARGTATYKRGDVLTIERREYEASIVPMGLAPPRSRTFVLLADEKKAADDKAGEKQASVDRIKAVRESVRDRETSIAESLTRARAMEADNARKLAEALKPLDQPGAHRVG